MTCFAASLNRNHSFLHCRWLWKECLYSGAVLAIEAECLKGNGMAAGCKAHHCDDQEINNGQ
eukprot:827804-Pyramimonas_sp.AAC.1